MTKVRLRRRDFLRLAAGAAAFQAVPRSAWAQTFPRRHVRLVVPFPPGGAADPIARILANRLSEAWGQQIVVENKSGAGGNLAAQSVSQAAPDGYTILVATSFLATNPFLYPTLGYDPVIDLAPIGFVGSFPNVMAVPNSSPFNTVGQFIEHAARNPGALTYASSGIGTSVHLAGELFKRKAAIEMTHVPYRGAGPALNDLIPGRVDAMFATLPSVLSHVRNGSLRALAVTTAARATLLPDIPTIAQSGVPWFDTSEWFALFAPARVPTETVEEINRDLVAALGHQDVRRKLEDLSASVRPSTPGELRGFLETEMNKWGPVIKSANIRPE